MRPRRLDLQPNCNLLFIFCRMIDDVTSCKSLQIVKNRDQNVKNFYDLRQITESRDNQMNNIWSLVQKKKTFDRWLQLHEENFSYFLPKEKKP